MADARPSQPDEITRILASAGAGDRRAVERLFPLVYHELRALAGDLFRNQNAAHTLQPTALVHDAYIRMVGARTGTWKDRAHFFAVAAQAMRQALIDHARRKQAEKRGGGWDRVTLDAAVAVDGHRTLDVLALEDVLARLAELDERKAKVVEMRFYGGLTNEEVAEVLEVSRTTVADDWEVARAWLRRELSRGERVDG